MFNGRLERNKKTERTPRYDMIREGDRLLVGLSGGKEIWGQGPNIGACLWWWFHSDFWKSFWDCLPQKLGKLMENDPI